MKLRIYLINLISFYQKNISVLTKPSCVFYPTCSEYAKEAVNKYGVIKGSRLSIWRILRCTPWKKHQIDLVP